MNTSDRSTDTQMESLGDFNDNSELVDIGLRWHTNTIFTWRKKPMGAVPPSVIMPLDQLPLAQLEINTEVDTDHMRLQLMVRHVKVVRTSSNNGSSRRL